MSQFKFNCFQFHLAFVVFANYFLVSGEAFNYFLHRDRIIEQEFEMSMAGSLKMSDLEQMANDNLLKYKILEWGAGFNNPGYSAMLQEIPIFLEQVQSLPIFQILQAMPKGANLHTHEVGMTSADFIFELTYRENLYFCLDNCTSLQLKFFTTPDASCNWVLLKDERRRNPFFDAYLKEKLSMLKKTPLKDSKEIREAIKEVQQIVSGILGLKEVFKEYVYQVLLELYVDGISYVEIKSALDHMYDECGILYNYDDVVDIYQEVLSDFQVEYPTFYGLKIIYTAPRNAPDEVLQYHLEIYAHLKDKYGPFIAGFDFDGNEDSSRSLKSQVSLLLPPMLNNSIEYYFHAGITNWYGGHSDRNLEDAVLLGSKRIGLATTLVKHPILMQTIIQKDIAIEVTPLGAKVQGLVQDIRSHPAGILAAFGMPLVIANGSPGLWGARGVTFDWYLAFMGIAGKQYDLAFLKKLAMNSIEYSALCAAEKSEFFEEWEHEWDDFIQDLADDVLVSKPMPKDKD